VSLQAQDLVMIDFIAYPLTMWTRMFCAVKVPSLILNKERGGEVRRAADKSLAFPISYFPICSATKRIFLGWFKEVRTTKS
jgi:hypothetical protein